MLSPYLNSIIIQVKQTKMKTKKKLAFYLSVAFLVIVVSHFILGKLFEESFDPEKHVCMDFEFSDSGGLFVKLEHYDRFYQNHKKEWDMWSCERKIIPENPEFQVYGIEEVWCCDKCISWRPKTYCELHPEDEQRCVYCEENIGMYCIRDARNKGLVTCTYMCVRARREKTLKDLSCEELDQSYDCFFRINFEECDSPYLEVIDLDHDGYVSNQDYDKQDILYLMFKKNCFKTGGE